MQNWTDVQKHGWMRPPVCRQLDLLRLAVRFVRLSDKQPGEGVCLCINCSRKPLPRQSLNDEPHCCREVGPALPVDEEIDVAARAFTHAVGSHRITAGQ